MFARAARIVVALLIVGFSTVWAQPDPLAQSPPPVSFAGAVNYGVGGGPFSVAVGDFNGDGCPDLAVANGNDNTVSVLLGHKTNNLCDGSFQGQQTYPIGNGPGGIAVADFNGDGIPDLAVANHGASSVSVLLGIGDGTFHPQQTYPVGADPQGIAVADFNGDGHADLAVTNQADNTVSVLLGTGCPMNMNCFQPQQTYPVGSVPSSVAVGDFNGVGNLDLAVANHGSNNVSVLLGDGTGGFSPATGSPYAAGTGPIGVAVGDFNGDGRLDLVTANQQGGNVSVLLSNGNGGFSRVDYDAGPNPNFVAVGDFNGDGKPDVAVANGGSNNVSILLSNGDGTFQAAANFSVGTDPNFVAVGYFNRDGKPDLVTANHGLNTVSILLNNTAAVPTNTALTVAPNPATAGEVVTLTATVTGNGNNVTVGTVSFLNGKQVLATVPFVKAGTATLKTRFAPGVLDLTAQYNPNNSFGYAKSNASQQLTVDGTEPTITTLTDQADGKNWDFTATVFGFGFPGLPGPTGTASFTDLTTLVNLGSVGLAGPGMSSFLPQQAYGTGIAPVGVASGDFNGDGIPDLVVTNYGDNTVSVLLGNGDGTFQPQKTYGVGQNPQSVAVADFNGDGVPDLAVTNYGATTVSVLLGKGDGTFQPQQTYTVGNISYSIAVADFNGDGGADLAVVNLGENTVSVLLGNGDGTFQPQQKYAVGNTPEGIAVGDFNGDGVADLAVVNQGDNTVSLLLGNGSGTFQQQQTYAVGQGPAFVAIADFNGDGIADLAVTNQGDNTVSVLLGNGNGTFQPQKTYGVGLNPKGIAVADFNGDGITDLAVTNILAHPPTVSVLLGNGDGTFQPQQTYAVGAAPYGIAVADFNGDGVPDVAIANNAGNTASVLLGGTVTSGQLKNVPVNGGSGVHMIQSTYAPDQGFYAGSLSNKVSVNGNGSLIPTTTTVTSSLNPSQFNQPVTFTATVTGSIGGSPTGTVNFTNDGAPLCNSVPLNGGGQAQCTTATLAEGKHAIVGTYSGDQNFATSNGGVNQVVNGDNSTTTSLSVAPNPATAGQVVTLTATVTSKGGAVNAGTVTFLSGKQVLATVQVVKASGTATLKTRFAPGVFQLNAQYNANDFFQASQSGPQQLTVTGVEPTITTLTDQPDGNNWDFTASVFGFGFPAPTGTASFTDLTTMMNLGSVGLAGPGMSSFQPQRPYATGSQPSGVAIGDFNGDGIADLAVTNGGGVSVLLGKGDGTFQPQQTYASGGIGIAVGDFNGDGIADFAVTNNGSQTVSVLLGKGDGTFQPQQTYPVGVQPWGVAVGDFNGDGIADLAIANECGNGNMCQGTVSVLLGKGDGTFQPQQTYAVGGNAIGVAVGDFNGDGIADLVVANNFDSTVSVLLGNGDGTFQPQQKYTTGFGSNFVAISDFNGDGKADLAVTNNGGTVSVLLGNGDGTFQPQQMYATGYGPAFDIAVADFNGDGIADLAVSNSLANTVIVLQGNGDGSFQPPQTYGVGSGPQGIAVADINGDGVPDVATANSNGNTASILLGGTVTSGQLLNVPVSGTGRQTIQGTYTTGTNFYTSSLSNLVTVIESASTATNLSVAPNPAAAGQVATLTATATSNGVPVTAGTVTFSNGQQVLATVQVVQASGTAALKTRFPPGTFGLTAQYNGSFGFHPSQSGPQTLTVTGMEPTITTLTEQPDGNNFDFTASVFGFGSQAPAGTVGFMDTTDQVPLGTVTLAGSGTSTFQQQQAYGVGLISIGIAVADFNGDGFPDLATASNHDNTASVLLGKGDGTFQPQQTYGTGIQPYGVATGDFNGDGFADLAVTNSGAPGTVSVLLGKGDGTFQPQQTYAVGNNPNGVAVADFNGDGIADLAVTNQSDNTVSVLLGNGDGTFQPQQAYDVGQAPVSLAVADFNGDGIADLAVADSHSAFVSVLLGKGDGTFQPQQINLVGSQPFGIAVGDFNGDSIADLAVTNQADYTVSVLLGTGDGTFQPQRKYAVGNSPVGIAVGDFNGDSIADLAVTNQSDNTVSLLLGNGDGTFRRQQTYAVGGGPYGIAVADFNGDGVPDVATASYYTASILLGGTTNSAQLKNVLIVGTGNHTIQSNYSPSASSIYAASTSNTVVVPAGGVKANPTVTLVATPTEINAGNSLLSIATVSASSGGIPTGTVGFTANGTTILGCGAVPLVQQQNGSTASCQTSSLLVGSQAIVAAYSGDSNFNSANSATVPVLVDPPFMLLTDKMMDTVPPGGNSQAQTNVIAAYQPNVYANMTCVAPPGTGITCSLACPPSNLGLPGACVVTSPTDIGTVTIKTSSGLARVVPLHRGGERRLIATLIGLGGFGLLGLILLPVKLRGKASAGILFLVIVVLCLGTSCGSSFQSAISSPPVNNTFYISVNAELREQLGTDPTKFRTLGLQKFLFTLVIK